MSSFTSHDRGPDMPKSLKSCDICREKKLKCDGNRLLCSYCAKHKYSCQYTRTRKKRLVRARKNTDGTSSTLEKAQAFSRYLEGRLARLELRLAAFEGRKEGTECGDGLENLTNPTEIAVLANEKTNPEQYCTAFDSSGSTSSADSEDALKNIGPAMKQVEIQEEVEQISNKLASLLTTDRGETRYIGSSSGFSIFSPQAVKWANSKIGDTSFEEVLQESIQSANQMVYWRPERFGDLFLRRVFIPLPSKAAAQSLAQDYFKNFNCAYPLFDEPTFMHLLNRQYSNEPCEGSGWWACLNAILAIAYRSRIPDSDIPEEEDRKASQYLKNSLGVLTELTMKNLDVLSIQALLAISLFLQGTPNPIPCTFLVSAAIRLSHSIGLHRRDISGSMNPREVEQRKRIFWIAYVIDKEICIRYGRPPVQDDDDTDVELPLESPLDAVGNIKLQSGVMANTFRLTVTFARIQSRVYKLLYSVKAEKQSGSELIKTIEELDKELEEWKDAIPFDIRPVHQTQTSDATKLTYVVVLHLSYFNCLTAIHRVSAHFGYWSSRISRYTRQRVNDVSSPRIKMSAVLCASAARSTINLLESVPRRDTACVWLIIYYPFSAVVTLFANILHSPHGAQAEDDAKLIHTACLFLSALNTDDNSGAFTQLLKICLGFEKVAERLLRKARHSDATTQPQLHKSDLENSRADDLSQLGNFDQEPISLGSEPENQLSYGYATTGMDGEMQDFYDSFRLRPDQNPFQESIYSQYWEMPMVDGWGLSDMSGMFYPESNPQAEANFDTF